MITLKECECHPTPKFWIVKIHKLENYAQEIVAPSFGLSRIVLARPLSGYEDRGVFFKAFGYFVILSLWRRKT